MIFFFIILSITIPLSILWVRGIDYMKENHPDYWGENLFDEEDKIHIS
jgi:hypothetical protein